MSRDDAARAGTTGRGHVASPRRQREDRRDPACTGDRNQFRIGIDGDPGAQVRLELTDLRLITCLAHLADLSQTDRCARVDQAGIDVQAGRSEDCKAFGNGERLGTNRRDLATINHHDAVRNVSRIDRMDRRPDDGVAMRWLCPLAPALRGEGEGEGCF